MKLELVFSIAFFAFSIKGQTVDQILPNTTTPVSYSILLTSGVPDAAVRFSGFASIDIKVHEETKEVYLHSRRHTFPTNSCKVFMGLELVGNCEISRKNDDVIRIGVDVSLQAESIYSIDFNYQGSLLLTSEGFFRNDYVSYETGTAVYT